MSDYRPDQRTDKLFELLEKLVHSGPLEPVDIALPRWLHNRLNEDDSVVLAAAAHLSALTRQGHVGAKIPVGENNIPRFAAEKPLDLTSGETELLDEWTQKIPVALENSGIVGSADDLKHPLIYDSGYLYFQRYQRYESTLAGMLLEKSTQPMPAFDEHEAVEWIDKLLPADADWDGIDYQQLAMWMALKKRLLILTGGPGTGKTYTLIRLVALRFLLRENSKHSLPSVALAAPTGKAAARINESIAESMTGLDKMLPDRVLQHLPTQAQTIHRLLGTRRNHPEFKHTSKNPLQHDIVVIDEASMVDIGLMTKLMEALKPGSQLILIGDKDQLASVEAGSVLGDICTPFDAEHNRFEVNRFSTGFRNEVSASSLMVLPETDTTNSSPVMDCMVQLERSRRFENSPGIGKLAAAVNSNKADETLKLLQKELNIAISESKGPDDLQIKLDNWNYLRQSFEKGNAAEFFAAWESFQILCAHRRGTRSVNAINRLIDNKLSKNGLENNNNQPVEWYAGRPIIITQNSYELDLYNGDIGITVQNPENDDALQVCFPARGEPDNAYRFISPAQLSDYQSAWALTVHKSQGSEFDEVLLMLPDETSPILTRELVYTALTRSKQKFAVWAKNTILREAITRNIQRTGALGERIWLPG